MSSTIQLQLLLATFAGWMGHQQTCVIEYLLEENRVPKEQIARNLRDCEDGLLTGQRSLDRTIEEYMEHYHDERSHQGIGNRIVSGAVLQSVGRIKVRQRLGGMLNYYHRMTA